MDVSTAISMIIAGGALALSLITTLKRNTKEDSATIAKMLAMLDSLAIDMKEIKDDFRRDIAELKVSHQTDHDNLVVVSRDQKSIWRSIDEIKAQIGMGGRNQ